MNREKISLDKTSLGHAQGRPRVDSIQVWGQPEVFHEISPWAGLGKARVV
jgi:hypothetical protein